MTNSPNRGAYIGLAAMAALLIGCGIAGNIGNGHALATEAPAPFIIEAIDANGEAWGAGAGDTCAEAMQGAVMPANVVTVTCRAL